MSLIFHALWMLCTLGAAVFAAVPPEKGDSPLFRALQKMRTAPFSPIALACGFALAALWTRFERLPDPASIGGLVAGVAALQLVRPGRGILTAAVAGALAAVWVSLLRLEALPRGIAVIVAAALPLLSIYLSARRARFAPRVLREEALLTVFALAVGVAVTPTVSQGWRSALALNLGEKNVPVQMLPAWTLGLTAGSITLGGLYSLWRRG